MTNFEVPALLPDEPSPEVSLVLDGDAFALNPDAVARERYIILSPTELLDVGNALSRHILKQRSEDISVFDNASWQSHARFL